MGCEELRRREGCRKGVSKSGALSWKSDDDVRTGKRRYVSSSQPQDEVAFVDEGGWPCFFCSFLLIFVHTFFVHFQNLLGH